MTENKIDIYMYISGVARGRAEGVAAPPPQDVEKIKKNFNGL